ncbi:MAG: ABC transporter ATP-binding protein [Proteobacteria bacterium]|nr:ABC transporter ATP-binding protein [Pseudomonadota bacterium]
MTTPLLACTDLAVGIGARTFCDRLTFAVAAGECWAIVGPNGAGKTTLLRTLAGLAAPRQGTILLGGDALAALPPRERARRVAWLPQDSHDAFATTVLATVLVACHPRLGWLDWESDADVAHAHAALAAFGVDDLAMRDVRTLSGGERRRVALAALVLQDAPLLLLDEPSSHLDLGHQDAALAAVCERVARERRAAVMVLHDLHLAARYCNGVIALAAGRAEVGSAQAMMTVDRMSALFGRPLVELTDGVRRSFVAR